MDKSYQKKKMTDIARIAAVSESTVSRALNNSPLVSKDTRERIQTIAREHNYVINKQAQNLRLQSSRTILVVLPGDHEPLQSVSDPFFMEIIGSVADALSAADYDLLLSKVHSDDWRQRVESRNFVDGIIFIGQSDIHDQLNEFSKVSHVPIVVWGAEMQQQNYITVGANNREGGRLATQRLIDKGRENIVFLGDKRLPEVGPRHEGYLEALRGAGLKVSRELTVQSGFSPISGRTAMLDLVASGVEFDAIFAASDVLASCAISVLAEAGRPVPERVAVVGFDDVAVSELMSPSLTTINQNIYQGGRQLVDSLFALIRGEAANNVQLTPKLVVRGSA